MRIVWNSEAAQRVVDLTDKVIEQIGASVDQSRSVLEALDEANPGKDNRRLLSITDSFDQLLRRLRQARNDAERLHAGARFMMDTFEDVERQAIDIIDSLEVGTPTYIPESDAAGMVSLVDQESVYLNDPIALSTPVIGAHSSLGPMAPVPDWLARSMADHFSR